MFRCNSNQCRSMGHPVDRDAAGFVLRVKVDLGLQGAHECGTMPASFFKLGEPRLQ